MRFCPQEKMDIQRDGKAMFKLMHLFFRPNYCGGCYAEFWKNGIQLLDCFDITVLG